jgi:hypothetical protein
MAEKQNRRAFTVGNRQNLDFYAIPCDPAHPRNSTRDLIATPPVPPSSTPTYGVWFTSGA